MSKQKEHVTLSVEGDENMSNIRLGCCATAIFLVLATSQWAKAETNATAPDSCSRTAVQDGCGTFTWPDGSRYVGGFHKGYFDDHAIVTFADGSKLESDFSDGSPYGEATFTNPRGIKIHGHFHAQVIDKNMPHRPLHYPFWRGLAGDEANLYISAIVTPVGHVTNAVILNPSPYDSFNQEALAGVSEWTYEPAKVGEVPVPTPIVILLEFNNGR